MMIIEYYFAVYNFFAFFIEKSILTVNNNFVLLKIITKSLFAIKTRQQERARLIFSAGDS